jgi:hypothetical protein
MPTPNDRSDSQRRARNVRVVNCYPSMCGGTSGRQPMAVITFTHGREILQPYCLSQMQAHVLVRDLITALNYLENNAHGTPGDTVTESLPLPPIPTAPKMKTKGRKIIQPSRRPSSPSGPIQATEAWQLHSLLKNVKSHDDFLKFISADAVSECPAQTAPARTSEPAAIKQVIAKRKRKGRTR